MASKKKAHSKLALSASYRTLRRAYREAKEHRSAAGKAYRRNKSAENRAKYRAAEMKWQATGAALGRMTKTHKPRHSRTKIFSRFHPLAGYKGAARIGRKRKGTKTRRRR